MKKFFTKKRIIWGSIIILILAFVIFQFAKGSDKSQNIITEPVKKQDIKQTVLATGQVVSQTDLTLAFKASGMVAKVNIKEGEKVKAGNVLATLEQRDQAATLTQARGSLAQAEANYQKILAGASSEEVLVSQRAVDAAKVTLENAKKSRDAAIQQQKVLVDNAFKAMLNSTPEAIPESSNINNTALTISGTYTGTEQGQYTIIQEGTSFYVRGLEMAGNQNINTSVSVPLPLGTRGLYVKFPTTISVANDKWTVSIPNVKAANYITNNSAYQAAQETQKTAVTTADNSVSAAEVALAQAEAALELKKAQARPADVSSAKAQILSAQGQVQAAEAVLENTIIRAPVEGTITKVDIKPGEQATALKEAMVLQDVGSLHVEANISEANIASLKTGQTVDLTFDALGMDRIFKGTIQTVNPASTVVSGVVNYKVTASMDKLEEVKPGMTANMTVLIAEKDNVLAIPQRAILSNNGKKTVRVIQDPKKKTYNETEVSIGMEADGGLVEILSGLNEGQEIVTLIKK